MPGFVAQSYASWKRIREGGWVKTEQDPLGPLTGTPAQPVMAAVGHVEDAVGKAGGAALRFGSLHGPGATEDMVDLIRKRQFPLVGGGNGDSSWVHLDDAASATVLCSCATPHGARASRKGWPDLAVLAREARPQ